jgi:hypothetical protein
VTRVPLKRLNPDSGCYTGIISQGEFSTAARPEPEVTGLKRTMVFIKKAVLIKLGDVKRFEVWGVCSSNQALLTGYRRRPRGGGGS